MRSSTGLRIEAARANSDVTSPARRAVFARDSTSRNKSMCTDRSSAVRDESMPTTYRRFWQKKIFFFIHLTHTKKTNCAEPNAARCSWQELFGRGTQPWRVYLGAAQTKISLKSTGESTKKPHVLFGADLLTVARNQQAPAQAHRQRAHDQSSALVRLDAVRLAAASMWRRFWRCCCRRRAKTMTMMTMMMMTKVMQSKLTTTMVTTNYYCYWSCFDWDRRDVARQYVAMCQRRRSAAANRTRLSRRHQWSFSIEM